MTLTLAFMAHLPKGVLTKTTNVSPGNGTLNTALAAASPGDTLQLEAGVYEGNGTVRTTGYLPTSYLLGQSVVLQGV